jgi:hypothetical protein
MFAVFGMFAVVTRSASFGLAGRRQPTVVAKLLIQLSIIQEV